MSAAAARNAGNAPEILYEVPGRCIVAIVDNVALHQWCSQIVAADAAALAEAADRLRPEYPEGISAVHWVRNATQLPTAAARESFIRTMARHGDWFGEAHVILEGDGFWVSAMRGMLTGLRLAAGNRSGFHIYALPDDCVAALPHAHLQRTGVHVPAERLRAALEVLSNRRACG